MNNSNLKKVLLLILIILFYISVFIIACFNESPFLVLKEKGFIALLSSLLISFMPILFTIILLISIFKGNKKIKKSVKNKNIEEIENKNKKEIKKAIFILIGLLTLLLILLLIGLIIF